jgi:hypothetical protein
MATTKEEILKWFLEAQAAGATHLIIATDTFDYEDYPVRVMPTDKKSVREQVAELDNPNKMSRVMEVYSMKLDPTYKLQSSAPTTSTDGPPMPNLRKRSSSKRSNLVRLALPSVPEDGLQRRGLLQQAGSLQVLPVLRSAFEASAP